MDHTKQLQMIGGPEVTKKFDDMFKSIKKVQEIAELKKRATKLYDDARKEEWAFVKTFGGQRYAKYLDKCSQNISDVEEVTKQLMSLTHKIYLNVGYIGKKIETIGYKHEVQTAFGEFL